MENIKAEKEKLEAEYKYIYNGEQYTNKKGETFTRGNAKYSQEASFFIENGGYSELMKTLDAAYKLGYEDFDPHPDFQDVYDTHIKYLTKEEVDKYINSAEGRKAIAVREIAEKNLGAGGAAAAAPKSDAKK